MRRASRASIRCLLVWSSFAWSSLAPARSGVELHVASGGRDSAPGSLEEPLESLEAARDAIRRLWKTSTSRSPVTVWIRGGVYFRTRTLELKKEDSGTEEAPVVYRAYGEESVRLVGGRRIEVSWCRPVADGKILELLGESVRGRVLQADLRAHGIADFGEMSIAGPMLELFSDGRRLPLARWPNEGWMHIDKIVEVGEDGAARLVAGSKRGTTFRYRGDRPRRWLGAEAVELHGFWWFGWMDQHVRIERIDPERREITLVSTPSGGMRENQWFRALNLLEEIDEPGEWYLDRSRGVLYFLPPQGFPDCEILVSTLAEPLVAMDGASHITLRGLTLEVTRGVAVVIGGGARNRLAGCTIRAVGSDGVVVDHGAGNGILGCDIHDIGSTAIRMTGGNRSTLEPSKNYVVNSHIYRYAQRKKVYRPAVRLYGVGHRVAHNLIHDAPHQAIAYDGNDHVIEFNEIHDVVLESSDAGVLYTGCDWTFRGNVVRHNFIHRIPHGPGLGTVGVYLDDCASSTHIIGNVFFDMLKPTFIGGGRDNRIENNIFIECETPVYLDNRGLRWDHFRPDGPMYEKLRRVPYDRPPWSDRYPELARILEEAPQAPLGNAVTRNVSVRSSWRDPEAFCRATSDKNIDRRYVRIADNYVTDEDPGFVDAARGNFQLRDDSIVYTKIPGFQRIPFETIGLYRDEYRATWPVVHGRGRGETRGGDGDLTPRRR